MIYLIVITLSLTVFHFIYESILAPSLRLQLRFRLFSLRDEVRNLRIEGVALDDRYFYYLQDSINTLLAHLPRFDVVTLARLESELQRNPEVRKRSESRCAIMDDCPLEQMHFIRRKCNEIGVAALAVNSGGWGVYVIPVVFVLVGLSELKRRIRGVLSLSKSDFSKMIPLDLVKSGPWHSAGVS